MNILLQQFHAELRGEIDLRPRYNVAPTQDIPIVRQTDSGRELTLAHWGLIPSWATDPKIGNRMINARSETASEKPSFRSAFKHRRCLIPADGFFEWRKVGSKKQPYWIHRPDEQPFAIAGLWETWKTIESCTILTTDANEVVARLHDRMPVILSPNDYAEWLDPKTKEPGKLLTPCPPSELVADPVSSVVNSPRNDNPKCIEPIDNPLE